MTETRIDDLIAAAEAGDVAAAEVLIAESARVLAEFVEQA